MDFNKIQCFWIIMLWYFPLRKKKDKNVENCSGKTSSSLHKGGLWCWKQGASRAVVHRINVNQQSWPWPWGVLSRGLPLSWWTLVSDHFCHRSWLSLWPCLLIQHPVLPYLEPQWSFHTLDFPASTRQKHNREDGIKTGVTARDMRPASAQPALCAPSLRAGTWEGQHSHLWWTNVPLESLQAGQSLYMDWSWLWGWNLFSVLV